MTSFPAFTVWAGQVFFGPIPLHPEDVEHFLALFAREGQHGLWLDLEIAHRKAGGIEHVAPFKRAA